VNTTTIIQQTQTWVKTVVIDQGFCPFAKREYDRDSIRYCVPATDNIQECLTTLILECQHLDTNPNCETTLLILAQGFQEFEAFLAFLDLAEALTRAQGYEGIYQLASFHPDYCFANAPKDDPANYTNCSPYPMLHLLRETSIAAALAHYPNPESIPERNCRYTRHLGSAIFRQLLADCLRSEAS
jgi:uncharacterized protein